jgi:hypothetical protein
MSRERVRGGKGDNEGAEARERGAAAIIPAGTASPLPLRSAAMQRSRPMLRGRSIDING